LVWPCFCHRQNSRLW